MCAYQASLLINVHRQGANADSAPGRAPNVIVWTVLVVLADAAAATVFLVQGFRGK
jgi:hypothetical protein